MSTIYVNSILKNPSLCDGFGYRTVLFLQGCDLCCKGFQNSSTWDITKGIPRDSGELVYKPNIVFKVHKGVNRFPKDKNFDLLEESLLCTAKKMIPTYLLCDCEADKDVDPYKLSIMGCRPRVVDDVFGY